MSLEEILEMRRIIITSGLSDEKVGRLNQLLNMALEDAKNDAINSLVKKFEEMDSCEFAMFSLCLIREKAEEVKKEK